LAYKLPTQNNKDLIMLKIFITLLVLTVATAAQANTEFFECTLPQAEEYRVGIDIQKETAGFFDNDTTSVMKLSGSRQSSRDQEVSVLIFKGKDQGGSGDLMLEFNTSTKRIKLSTVETDGTIELLGFANCKSDRAPWDFEDFQ
jgi:hypothetical protein